MARSNGKPEVEQSLDPGRELASSDDLSEPAPREEMESAEGSELDKLRAERNALVDRLARMQADFENARKRAAREQQEFREFAVADAVKSILPVLDSFERALHAAAGEKSELRSGIELIYKQMNDALQKLGVRPVPARGAQFDPHVHEAVEMVDTTEARDHEVLEELQRGYKLKDRLLRPAMVKVASNSKH
jgi:molecular chaperone GrpE